MATVGEGVRVDSASLKRTLDELSELAPDLRKDLLGELGIIAGEIRADAASRIVSRTHESARGYKVQVSAGRGVRIVGTTAGAAISEFAGSVNPAGKCPQGASLVSTLNATYGKPGRILWAAFDARKEEMERRVAESVRHTEEALNVRMHRV